MSHTQNESSKTKRRWRLALTSVIFIYLLFRLTPSLSAVRFRTVFPEEDLVQNRIKAEGVVIKKEIVYQADGEGQIELLAEEGQRLAKGDMVARLLLLKDTSSLNESLKDINQQIDKLEDIKESGYIIEENVGDIQYKDLEIKSEDFNNELLINQSLEKLQQKQEEIKKQISNNSKNYITNEPGVISFQIDGYEELYHVNHKENYRPSDIKKIEEENKKVADRDQVSVGEPLFKIIDNFEWYMIINVDKDISKTYNEGDQIVISGEEAEGLIYGHIEKINNEKNQSLFLCRFKTDFQDYYDKRHVGIDIIKNKQEGYKIPTKSIVEKDGKKGVHVKDISGIIRFKPVKVLLEKDGTTYIDSGDVDNNIEIGGSDQKIKTITGWDEILLNTVGVKEGMVIN